MKLLLDENLSRRIESLLHTLYPGRRQVVPEGLEQADDKDAVLVDYRDYH
ncbi:MAG: DUF5615 family PIN-like protein [Chromatiaceae bacterium]|jgi:predicted nuclease of predicted toxin-antitoxin system|nr:DUF5615 family PIN-like protein [Chromatiaceae bacterium]